MAQTALRDDPKSVFDENGYLSPVQIISPQEAQDHRERLETAEQTFGPLHYTVKSHTILTSPLELATHPRVLDVVEQLIGPDVLLFDVTYIVKEPHAPSHVSWHQDLTYWGFDSDDQVSMWLALTDANEESGCMRMIPGSHKAGKQDHSLTEDDTNVLRRGQTVSGIDESSAELCPLRPGEASFHHGWTLHASMPNQSDDRRIGLNVQYINPRMKQLINPNETALLVRGEDRYGNYGTDIPATSDLDLAALERQTRLDEARKTTWDTA